MNIIKIKLSVTNCYLVSSKNGYVLIDSGYDYEWELFKHKLAENGISMGQISYIILTHHHDDHSGLLNNIISENKNIKIVMSVLAPALLANGKNDRSKGGLINKRINFLTKFKILYLSIILHKKIDKQNNLTFPPYYVRNNDILIKEDTKLKDIGIDIDGKIILTPGHSIDSISIIFENGISIVGDAAANFLRFAGTKYCVIFVRDLDEYYKSWEKIISENAEKIYPAHGKMFKMEKLKKNIWKNKKENMVK